ncbi:MAG: hypothetical protein FWE42_01950 [Defluviitaleaceae bacterium]|nr:hypothetical protein [Defluviitaleaceae bacterium]
MIKKNYQEAVARNKRFLKREMMDGILFKATVSQNPYAKEENRDRTWQDRECLAVTGKEWIMSNFRSNTSIYQDIEDDTIPTIYPTLHFGESIYSALLGGEIQFVGSEYHTCSGAKPLIREASDLEKIKDYHENKWVKIFTESAAYFAAETKGDFWLNYMISIDALNLAVELLGTTEAYQMLYDDEVLLNKIMAFGIDFNYWFYKHQKSIYEKNNRAALYDAEFYDLYDKTWYSIDAYTICNPDMYVKFGLEYQQELINRVGGGMLHTHGTALLQLLPHISRLKGLGRLQIGRDLYSGEHMGLEHLHDTRKMTGDTPLQINASHEEFTSRLQNRSLPGGVEYLVHVETVDEANRLAYLAKGYHAPSL